MPKTTASKALAAYLAGPPKRLQGDIAKACGVKQQTISRWASGEDEPVDFDTQLRLEEATGGAVKVEFWLSKRSADRLRARLASVVPAPPKTAA